MPFRDEDFIEKMLRDYPEMAPYRTLLYEYAQTQSSRDDDLEGFLEQDSFAPGIGVSLVTPQSVPTASAATIVFDQLDFQSSDLFQWDGATKILVGQRGVVSVTANLSFQVNVTGDIRLGGVELNALSELVPMVGVNPIVGDAPAVGAKSYPLEAGDELTLFAVHNAGTNLGVTGSLQLAFLGNVDG